MADIQGICIEEFVGVREALARNLDSGADIGASAAVFIDGEPVVDIWGGNGGSWVHVDMDARMTVAFVMNRWIDGLDLGRCFDIVNAAYDSLGMRS